MNVVYLKKPPSFFSLVLKLIGLYVAIFFICRLVFCYFNIPALNNESFRDYLSAFVLGMRFDLIIISGMLMLPAATIVLHQNFFPGNLFLVRLTKIILLLETALAFFIACADIPYFSQFGSHINKSVMVWRLTPDYTLKLIFSSFHYWGFFLLFLLFFVSIIFLINRVFKTYSKEIEEQEKPGRLKNSLYFLVLAFILFAFVRGRLYSKSTMHEGMAIVGQNAFVNQIALNPNFTLIKSLSLKEANGNYFENIKNDQKICTSFFNENYFPPKGILELPIKSSTPADSINRLNVVVVLMESLNMSKLGYHNNKNLSPYLNQLAQESVFFDRFFSSGIHTFNGLFSTCTGFPSIYDEQGLRRYTKQPFTTLATLLKPYGYRTFFCTTHDPVFDNMEGFFKLNGYDQIISEADFKITESIGVTGVPDHLLYEKFIEKINGNTAPFVAYIMTGTDHGPWATPSDISFTPSGANAQENASMYADWSVKQFIEEAKKQSWYKNTVFVFLGDHGQIMNDPYDMPITYHHTPLIIHCPQILEPATNHNLGYQPDIVKTISSILKLNYLNFSFGENIFIKSRPFVFFSADDKLGYVTDDDFFFYHTFADNQKKFIKYQNLENRDYYNEYKRRADSLYNITKSLYNSASYYIKNNYANN
jgi:phosphoglycerol transferase MdoB-like AlkP superfamily enzyme